MSKYKQREHIQEPPDFKNFNGKHYELHSMPLTARSALKQITVLRKAGYFARIVTYSIGYAIYKRRR